MLYSNLVRSNFDINGWIPEWPKGTDCKSAANCFGGSNPPPPIKFCSLNFYVRRVGLNSSSKPIRCAARRKEVCPLGTSRAQEFASKFLYYAGVAELADAQDLKSCRSNTVPVRFRSPALKRKRLKTFPFLLLFFKFTRNHGRRFAFYQLRTKHRLADGNVVNQGAKCCVSTTS